MFGQKNDLSNVQFFLEQILRDKMILKYYKFFLLDILES